LNEIAISTESIILASGSASRRTILEAAGVAIIVDPSDVNEETIKRSCVAERLDVWQTAATLAAAKAARVSTRHPGRIVLGADQMLECEGEWLDKPADRNEAARQLARLGGKTHHLISAAIAVRDGAELWSFTDSAELIMRPLSPQFIHSYLDRVGDKALGSVGGYQIEGVGVQLFHEIRGDHFTIMGLPLLPLLTFLRHEGTIAT